MLTYETLNIFSYQFFFFYITLFVFFFILLIAKSENKSNPSRELFHIYCSNDDAFCLPISIYLTRCKSQIAASVRRLRCKLASCKYIIGGIPYTIYLNACLVIFLFSKLRCFSLVAESLKILGNPSLSIASSRLYYLSSGDEWIIPKTFYWTVIDRSAIGKADRLRTYFFHGVLWLTLLIKKKEKQNKTGASNILLKNWNLYSRRTCIIYEIVRNAVIMVC